MYVNLSHAWFVNYQLPSNGRVCARTSPLPPLPLPSPRAGSAKPGYRPRAAATPVHMPQEPGSEDSVIPDAHWTPVRAFSLAKFISKTIHPSINPSINQSTVSLLIVYEWLRATTQC